MSRTIIATELQPGDVYKKYNHHNPIGVMSAEEVNGKVRVMTVDCRSKHYLPGESVILLENNPVVFLPANRLQPGMNFSSLRDRRRRILVESEVVSGDSSSIVLRFKGIGGETLPALPCGLEPHTDHNQVWKVQSHGPSLVIVCKDWWKAEWDSQLTVLRCVNCGRPDYNATSMLDECPYCFYKHEMHA
jgi:hypothetical protein